MTNQELYELVSKYISKDYEGYLNLNGVNKIAGFKSDKDNELRIMKIHYENVKQSGLQVIGINSLIAELTDFHESNVYLINVRNDNYFFKFYFDLLLKKNLGYIIIKLRKKTRKNYVGGKKFSA
ncbi:hypothetical protein [Mixta intestinalis]|uniref:Uncharacterized protein n=1 Tax=Mixta intestinalis TaxID=1615494 RepID=A0A6P1Q765_9GAMM|nr:hypothetical protein [Mixta intestinalis]QHM73919.1 hypothetical protein C7M51_04280 [Mixta intestinalis]